MPSPTTFNCGLGTEHYGYKFVNRLAASIVGWEDGGANGQGIVLNKEYTDYLGHDAGAYVEEDPQLQRCSDGPTTG